MTVALRMTTSRCFLTLAGVSLLSDNCCNNKNKLHRVHARNFIDNTSFKKTDKHLSGKQSHSDINLNCMTCTYQSAVAVRPQEARVTERPEVGQRDVDAVAEVERERLRRPVVGRRE